MHIKIVAHLMNADNLELVLSDCVTMEPHRHTSYAGWGTMRVDAPARAEDPSPSPVPAAFVHDENEMIELMPIAFAQLFPWTKGANR